MANGHGGARAGAGRPRNQDKYATEIASFHDQVAADIADRYAALQQLADGGFEEIEEEWVPAGLVTIQKTLETADGAMRVSELAFPHLPPDQLVCVKRKRTVAAPDYKANAYLVDRLAGKPTAAIETDLNVNDPDRLVERFEASVAKIYGDAGERD